MVSMDACRAILLLCVLVVLSPLTGKACEPTQAANSDHNGVGAIRGVKGENTAVRILCGNGYYGGGVWTCGDDGQWKEQACKKKSAFNIFASNKPKDRGCTDDDKGLLEHPAAKQGNGLGQKPESCKHIEAEGACLEHYIAKVYCPQSCSDGQCTMADTAMPGSSGGEDGQQPVDGQEMGAQEEPFECLDDTKETCRILSCKHEFNNNGDRLQKCGWSSSYRCLCKPGYCAVQAAKGVKYHHCIPAADAANAHKTYTKVRQFQEDKPNMPLDQDLQKEKDAVEMGTQTGQQQTVVTNQQQSLQPEQNVVTNVDNNEKTTNVDNKEPSAPLVKDNFR